MTKLLKIKTMGLVLVIACVGVFVYSKYCGNSENIILNGNVEIQDVNVSFRVSGRVQKILVNEGDSVKTGDVLAVLETDIFSSQVQWAKAKLEEASINLKNAKKDFNRNAELYKKHSVSEKVYDDAKVKYDSAEAEKNSAEALYKMATISLNDATIKSPTDGVVLTRNIEVGEMITSGIPAFSIMPNEKTKVKTYANAEILTRIKVGDKVEVGVDALPDKKFKGHIAFISSESEFTPKNIETKELRTSLVYRIRVIVDDSAYEIKQGMPVTVYVND